MYAAERRRRILDIIRSQESVAVSELADMFEVSPSTIRRDLNELDRADLLERTYGGAITSLLQAYEPPFNERSVSHREEKCRIGQAAAGLVKPGQTILIDGGTTTECMVQYLLETPDLTVVTYGLNIAAALSGHEHITVIGIGGMLHHPSQSFGGVLAIDALQAYNMRFDQGFLAASGISAEGGVTNVGFDEITMKRKTIELSREVTLLADSSKVGANAIGFIAPASKIHRLISDSEAAPDEVEKLRDLGLVVDLV